MEGHALVEAPLFSGPGEQWIAMKIMLCLAMSFVHFNREVLRINL